MCESRAKWQLCGLVNTQAADGPRTRTCVLLHLTKVLISGESWAPHGPGALGDAAPSPPSGKNTLCQAPRQRCLPATLQGRSKARPRPTPPAGCLWHLQRDVCLTRVEILNNGSCRLLWQEGKVIYSAGPGMDSNSLKLSGVGLSVCPMGTSFPDHCIPRLKKDNPRTTVNACACFPFLLYG